SAPSSRTTAGVRRPTASGCACAPGPAGPSSPRAAARAAPACRPDTVLPAAARLRRRAEFAAVVRGGRRAGRGAVVVHLTMPTAPPPATARETAREPVADGVPAAAPADPAEPIRAGTPTVPARFGMLGANPPDMVQAETMPG